MSLSNTYLYGTEDVPPIPQEVIDGRVELLKAHMEVLLRKPGAVGTTRVKKVYDAIGHWERMRPTSTSPEALQ